MEIRNQADKLIDLALAEDIGPGDITTDNLVDAQVPGHGKIVAKQDLVIAGLDIAKRVFQRLDDGIVFDAAFQDGEFVVGGSRVVTLSGRLAALLSAERTALNFLQRLSGIATQVREYVSQLEGASAKLLDTRKTTPGWRVLEKYAVRIGGGTNHRMGLYDAVLIKDNHIAAAGGIAEAVDRIKAKVSAAVTIEVETTSMEEVRQALDAGAHIIMLDNMDLHQIKAAVDLVSGRAQLEVSGGVTRDQLTALAATGVDLISSGALTHSACAVDLSMKIAAE
ncbi:MAG: carboxylating nicotinate-nucleotide diphosphorylase [Desulfobacteraceae bacterium]|jgi:nicotinate-nucleotide pyrophosphorylase (carboxylating)